MWEQSGTSSWTMGVPSGVVASFQSFTHEIYVLLVDHEKESLASMARMLELYSYKVTAVQSGSIALSLLFDGQNQFDLMVTDIHLPDVDPFVLLQESVNRDLPTVFMSGDEDAMVAKIALEQGACFFIEKPTGSNVVKSLWQHVIKERLYKAKIYGKKEIKINHYETTTQDGIRVSNSEENINLDPGIHQSDTNCKKGTDASKKKARHIDMGSNEDYEIGESYKVSRKSAKKFCTEWTDDLHRKFMAAVDHLGEGRCYPKEILELMNVPGLTRMQVASHLQKCRNDNWRAPETRKSNTSGGQSNVSPNKFGSRKFGSMPRLVRKSSSHPQTSQVQESWGHEKSPGIYSTPGNNFMGYKEGEYSVPLIQSQPHIVPNCVGGNNNNILPHNSSIQTNVEQIGGNGSNNVIYNGAYLNATSNATGDQNYLRPIPCHLSNTMFGADSHSSASNQTPVTDDFFDFLPEIEGCHGFSKYLGGSSTMIYGSIPETQTTFDVEPIFYDRHEGHPR